MPPKRIKAYIALLTTAAIWGIAGPVIKATLPFIPPFTFLFYRFIIVAGVCLPLFIYQWRKEKLTIKDLPELFFLGLMAVTLNLGLIFLGYEKTTALDGSLISSITPIFIVLGGIIFFKDKVTKIEKAGLAIVILGVLITVIQPLLENGVFASKNIFGNLLILLAGIQWTIYVLLAKKDSKQHSPLTLTTSAGLVGLITFAPLSLLETNLPIIINPLSIFGLVYMALVSYVVAYFTYHYGINKIEVSEAAIFTYLQPVFAAPLAIFWLGEKITLPFLIGAGVITTGVILSEWKSRS